MHLTKEDLALSHTTIETWFTQQNKWLPVVLVVSSIGVLSFVVSIIMVKKWFSIRNTVTSINKSVSEVAKQLGGDIFLLLNTIRGGGETASLNDCLKENIIKIRIMWLEILILIMYEVIILVVIILVERLAKHVYRLCNFNNLQMLERYVKQNCCPIGILGNKSDIFLEISSVTNVNSIRIYIGTTVGYPT